MKGASYSMLPFNGRMLLNKKTVMIAEFLYARLFSYSFAQHLNLICAVYIGISDEIFEVAVCKCM